MNTKIILALVLGISFLFFGCAQQPAGNMTPPVTAPDTEDESLVGGDEDEHGCIGSAGYVWCEVKNKCVRPWEEPCVEGSITLDEARNAALDSPCMDEGNITDDYSYNNVTNTWWFDMDIVKEGCAPACVVYANKTAEINWRCTGLIVPEENETTEEEPETSTGEDETQETNVSDEQLADLFHIEGEEPLGDEGLDTSTPDSNSS